MIFLNPELETATNGFAFSYKLYANYESFHLFIFKYEMIMRERDGGRGEEGRERERERERERVELTKALLA